MNDLAKLCAICLIPAEFTSNFNVIVAARSTRAKGLLIDWVEINMVNKWVIYYYVKLFAGSVLLHSWPIRPRLQRNDCFMFSHGLNVEMSNESRILIWYFHTLASCLLNFNDFVGELFQNMLGSHLWWFSCFI